MSNGTPQHSPHSGNHGTSEGTDLSHYWNVIQNSKWSILSLTLLSLAVGGVVATVTKPAYKATSKILADPQQPNASRADQQMSAALAFLFYETQYEIIQSRKVAESVVDKLGLVEAYKAEKAEEAGDDALQTSLSFIETIQEKVSDLVNREDAKDDESEEPTTDPEIRLELASDLQENLEVTGGKTSKIIRLSYVSQDRQKAAAVVNAVSDAYIAYGLSERMGEAKNTQDWLKTQAEALKDKLQDSEARLRAFQESEGLVNTNSQQQVASTQISALNAELIRAQTQLSAAAEQYNLVKNVTPGSKESYSLGPVLENRMTNELIRSRTRLQQRIAELSERYGNRHPTIVGARKELESVQNALDMEVSKVISNIEKAYRLAQSQVTNINRLIKKNKEEFQSIQGASFNLTALEREVENNRRTYESFMAQLTEAKVNSEFEGTNIKIIDRAAVPTKPFKPNKAMIIAALGMFGFLLGILQAIIRDAFNKTFKSTQYIEEKLSVSCLGVTPAIKHGRNDPKPEMQYLRDSRSVFAESINTIRTGLLFSNIDTPPQAILITSANGSEGKSTLALNLATAYSHLGRTLLLEVDLRKPSLARNVEFEGEFGLSDVIAGTISLLNVLEFANDKQLALLPCGTIPHDPLELLSSQMFDKLLTSLRKNFDYIILDGPPTLPVSDSCVLSNKVDGVVVAIKAGETRINTAKEAIRRLQNHQANVIGGVLTAAHVDKNSYYGDSYYGTKDIN